MSRQRFVVIGGGITGLAAAHRLVELREEKKADFDILLLEAENRLGGVMGTDYRNGFVLEWGPDSFISEKPWAFRLADRIGLTPHLVRTNDEHRRNFVVYDGRLHPLPDGFLMMAPTQFLPLVQSSLFSLPGKLRMGLDLVLPRGGTGGDESLGSFVTRRLGREALERVVQPLVGGIYTADPDQLSLQATMPRFLEMERQNRSVIATMWRQARAMAAAQKGPAKPMSGARWSLFVSVDRGMQGLVDAIAQRLPEESVRVGCAVKALQRSQRWQVITAAGESIDADGLVLAPPAHVAARLLEPLDPASAADLRDTPYTSSATVSLAFRRDQVPDALDGFGFVVPRVERRGIIACTYSSVKYPGRAPAGHVLLRAFIGGAFQEELAKQDEERMVESVRRELQQLLRIDEPPSFTNIHRHHQAMPQYKVGHLERLERVEKRLQQLPGLYLAGNGYRGVGVPDCIHSGESAAETLVSSAPSHLRTET